MNFPSDTDDSCSPSTTEPRPADVRVAAMNLLARREHSLQELQQKLQRRFADAGMVAEVLHVLREENLQSDQRYAESLLRQRLSRGYGPLRLRREMRERGLDDAAIDIAHAAVQPDWFALAESAYLKKFGSDPAGGVVATERTEQSQGNREEQRALQQAALREKARRSRFMQYRGFLPEHFCHLLED
ncbi:regulatory protein RecX [Kineobactrum salinum]|uniref:regulatory protein RecX n=1 Tax=Kineobactrum salinum TaxID=2708301 RepID=UPI001E28293E|nr:regulatory protein RecX [Kineobactrum salinum]